MVPIAHGSIVISEKKKKSFAFLLDLYLYFLNNPGTKKKCVKFKVRVTFRFLATGCRQEKINSHSAGHTQTFTLQMKIVKIMVGVKPTNSCRCLLKRLEILPLPHKYIFSLMNCTVNNHEHFQTNSIVHSVNTRNR
jgi:hypothetical protein